MTEPTRIVDVFRHAQSTSNAGMPTDDAVTIPLTELGRAQAEALSQTFDSANPPEAIIVSPYIRTALTASPTHMRFPAARYMVWPIHEFTYLTTDHYRGTTREQRHSGSSAYWLRGDPNYRDGPGAESFNDLVGRIDGMIDKVKRLPYAYSAAFCHGLTMRLLFLRLTEPHLNGADLMQRTNDLRLNETLPNTARLRLEATGSEVKVIERWPAKSQQMAA